MISKSMLIRPFQIRAATALLGPSQADLAELAKIGLATLQRVEASNHDLRGSVQTLKKLERALRGAGVVFIEQDDKHGQGVRLKKRLQ